MQSGDSRMRSTRALVLLVIFIVSSSSSRPATDALPWSIFSSSLSKKAVVTAMPRLDGGAATAADFSIDGGAGDPRAAKLLEDMRRRIEGPASCWNEAYRSLFAGCAAIMADKERQSRLAWHLTSCFQEDSDRPPLPPCDERSEMVHCRSRLVDAERQGEGCFAPN